MKLIHLIFLVSAGLSLSSCNYSKLKTNASPEKESTQDMQLSSYEGVKNQVLNKHCLNCHSNSGGNKGNLNLETIESIRQNLASIYDRTFEVKDMPPSNSMTKSEFTLFKNWIEAGAPEVPSSSLKLKPTGPVSFENLTNYSLRVCLECHSGLAPEGSLDLSNYEVVKQSYVKIFERAIFNKDMPPKPYSLISPPEAEYFAKWVASGMPK